MSVVNKYRIYAMRTRFLIKRMVMMICLSVQGMAVVHAQQSKRELSFSIDSIPKIEIAVELIKKFEGIHRDSTCFPYYGYGHCLLPGEKLSYGMTETEAEILLRKDLEVRYKLFRKFGKDALLLTVLSYNVGQGVLLGHGGHPKSKLVRKLEAGNRDIYREYVAYCRYKGKIVRSIERRRKMEFLLLYEP